MNIPAVTEKDNYKKRSDYHSLIEAQAPVQLKKLRENEHKRNITLLGIHEAIELMDKERIELQEELNRHEETLEEYLSRLIRMNDELGDILNFAGSGVCAVNKEIRATVELINSETEG